MIHCLVLVSSDFPLTILNEFFTRMFHSRFFFISFGLVLLNV